MANMAYGYTPQASAQPPRYSDVVGGPPLIDNAWYDPRGWSMKKRLIVTACMVIVVIVVVVGAVEGVKANAYPKYSPLNYSLRDTYSGLSFFDNFEYYTSTDPTHGFVQYVHSFHGLRLMH